MDFFPKVKLKRKKKNDPLYVSYVRILPCHPPIGKTVTVICLVTVPSGFVAVHM